MSQATPSARSFATLATATQGLDREMRFLFFPASKRKLAARSYQLGVDCRDADQVELARTNFSRVFTIYQGVRPDSTLQSLKVFNVVAASHNHFGLTYLDAGSSGGDPFFDRAIELRRELLRLFPKDRENAVYLGGVLCNRGHSVADANASAAEEYYRQSLAVLRQPERSCDCSYWDEALQSWWCSQLEAMAQTLRLDWVILAPHFLENAMEGLASLEVS